MKKKLLLVDGYSIICRGFYALPLLTSDKGIHTNAVLGFLNILHKTIEDENPDYIAVAFDENKNTFRHNLYKDYKAQRSAMPEELKEQVPYVKEILKSFNISIFSKEGFEADDILGTLSNKFADKNTEAVILSGDKDMLQLATDDIKIRLIKTVNKKSEAFLYYEKDVIDEYNMTPVEFIDMKAIMGDPSDNIKGIKGIGQVTAKNLISTYKSIENIYNHLDEINKPSIKKALEEQKEDAKFFKMLVTIKKDVPIECDLNDLIIHDMYNEKAFEVIKKLDLKSQFKYFPANVKNNKKFDDIANQKLYDDELPFDDSALKDTNVVKKVDDDNSSVVDEKRKLIYDKNIIKFDEKLLNKKPTIITNKNDIIKILNSINNDQIVGLYAINLSNDDEDSLIKKNDLQVLSITTKNDSYIFVADKIDKELLALKNKFVVLDLKQQLKYFDNENDKKFIFEDKNKFDDLSLISYLLSPIDKEFTYDFLAKKYLGVTLKTEKEILGKKSLIDFINIDNDIDEEILLFISYKSKIPFILYEELKNKLEKLNLSDLYNDIELPLTFVLYNMEKVGILCDKKALSEYDKKLDKLIIDLTDEIHTLADDKDFNINSPKQLGEIIFNKLSLKDKLKSNEKQSTAAEVLEKLKEFHPIIPKILDYRTVSKLSSTYAKGLPSFIDIDNRIHTHFNQTETATGRLSSDNPNLQNIPVRTELGKELRKVFIPKDGFVFIDADYSQIELRILAIISDDSALINAYKGESDVHTITASQVFGVPTDKVTPDLRRKAKAVNFGIIYGMSTFGLSEDLNIDTKEAKKYIDKYFATYEKVKLYLDNVVKDAETNAYTTTMFGRIRPIPEFITGNGMQKAFAKRVAMNSPIQGTASDIIKKAMILVEEEFIKQKLESRMVLQVHDEILIETKIGEEEKVKNILLKSMKDYFKYKVSLEINIETGKNFEEVH